jgi:predicted amidohydrolase YtcJ
MFSCVNRIAAFLICVFWMGPALAQSADKVLLNGKVVTADDRFSIGEALAIRGERIVAVGSNGEIEKLKGAGTQIIDLHGRTVIPGLIDNHAHYMRAAEYWDREVRLDGVTSHKAALDMIRRKAGESKPGEWVLVLGGWAEEQFTDEKRGFTKAELDAVAPSNPVALQLIYFRIYTNSSGLKALGIGADTPDMPGGKIEKENGQPTGVLNGAGAVASTLAKLGEVPREKMVANARAIMHDLNQLGITAYEDMGGRGLHPGHIEAFRAAHDAGEMTVRSFYNYFVAESAGDVDKLVAAIGQLKPFQGDDYFDLVGFGETVYPGTGDNLLAASANVSPQAMQNWRRVAQAVADRGLYLNVHAQLRGTIEPFLAAIEEVNKGKPVKNLRWTFSHLDQVEPRDLERMKKLDMYAMIHSRPSIQGAMLLKIHGERAYDMPPFRTIQDSGVHWGLGSDATAVTPSNPFYTLALAVTGKMIGGDKVLRQTITREEALIAHTRSNAYFLFEEENLGSLQPGKYADLLVLDRGYLTVPADEIKDIKPLLTMVGGKIVYDAMPRQ